MQKAPEHVRAALRKEKQLFSLTEIGYRFIDHNLMHEIDRQVGNNAQLDMYSTKLTMMPKETPVFDILKIRWGRGRRGMNIHDFEEPTHFESYSNYNSSFWELCRKYFGHGNFDSAGRTVGRPLPAEIDEVPAGRFAKFKRDIVENQGIRRIVKEIPENLNPDQTLRKAQSLGKKTIRPNDAQAVEEFRLKSAAFTLAYYAPHHASTLKSLFEDPENFGSMPGEKMALIRAAAYFFMDWKHELSPPRVNSPPSRFTDSQGFSLHYLETPFSYTAAVFIHPKNVTKQGVYAFWLGIKRGKQLPILGMVVTEPTKTAAIDAADRMLKTLEAQGRLKEAFPVYDYRFNRVWPPRL